MYRARCFRDAAEKASWKEMKDLMTLDEVRRCSRCVMTSSFHLSRSVQVLGVFRTELARRGKLARLLLAPLLYRSISFVIAQQTAASTRR